MSDRHDAGNGDADALDLLAYAVQAAGIRVPGLVLPRDRDVLLGGMRFHFLDWGNEGARPILFLHGGGLTAHTYDLVCLALRTDYRCLSLDQRGHGDSEWSPVEDYGTATHAADIAAFIDAFDLSGLVMVGMSMGALNAIHYAADHGDRLAALILIDAGPEMHVAVREHGHVRRAPCPRGGASRPA